MEKINGTTTTTFQNKVWIVCGITSLFIALCWFFFATFNVILHIFAGILFALFFHGFAQLIHRKTKVGQKASLLISIISTFIILGLLLWFMGTTIEVQITQLAKTLPATIANAKVKLSGTPLGQKLLSQTSADDIYNKGYAYLSTLTNSTFGVFTDIYIVLFLGLFFTAAPLVYKNGFLLLIPPAAKARVHYTIDRIGFTLTKWLKGQLFGMVIVSVLKGIALTAMGIPMASALALIAGLLNFIPNFGPLISMFPAILIALTLGINKAIMVTLVYLAIQILDGNVITTSIQKRLINMPAALIIIAQLFMGILAGVWGLILATPLLIILMIVVDETYVKRINEGY